MESPPKRGRPPGIKETRPRQPKLSPEVRAEIIRSAVDRLKAGYERAIDLWLKIMDDDDEPMTNRIAASDRIAAYAIGKPTHRETAKDSDADAVRRITEGRRAFDSLGDSRKPDLPALPAPASPSDPDRDRGAAGESAKSNVENTSKNGGSVDIKRDRPTRPSTLTLLQRLDHSMDDAIRR